MLFDNRRYTFDRVVRLLLGCSALIGLIWLLGYLSDVLIPFAIAFLLAYLFNPLVTVLQRIGIHNRLGAVLLSLILVAGALTAAGFIIIPMIFAQVEQMAQIIAKLVSDKDLAQEAVKRLPPDLWAQIQQFLKGVNLEEYLHSDSFLEMARTITTRILPLGKGLFSGALSVVLGVAGMIVILLYTIFLMLDFQKVRTDWQKLVPPDYRAFVVTFVQDFDSGMNRYFRAQATISAIAAVVFAIGFQFIGLPMGILLGLFIGLLTMVPYLQILGFIPAILLALAKALNTGQSFWLLLLLIVVVYAVAQIVMDLILTPRIMGDATGLSPALILLSLSVWGKMLGLLGLLIALPMTCLLLAYYQRLLTGSKPAEEELPPEPPVTSGA